MCLRYLLRKSQDTSPQEERGDDNAVDGTKAKSLSSKIDEPLERHSFYCPVVFASQALSLLCRLSSLQ